MSWTAAHPLVIVAAFFFGAALGTLYFWGLWVTVRRLPAARRPGLLAMGSFMGRMAILLLGLALLVRDQRWWTLLAAIGGMLVARTLLVRRIGTGLSDTRRESPGHAEAVASDPGGRAESETGEESRGHNA